MRTQAAVLYEARTDWKVEEIELDPPRAERSWSGWPPPGSATPRNITGSATSRSPGR